MYIFLFIPILCVYKVVVVNLLDYLLDITELEALEAQAFRYIHINICKPCGWCVYGHIQSLPIPVCCPDMLQDGPQCLCSQES